MGRGLFAVHREKRVVLKDERAAVWLQDAPRRAVPGLFNWEVWMCPLYTCSSAQISIAGAVWDCVDELL